LGADGPRAASVKIERKGGRSVAVARKRKGARNVRKRRGAGDLRPERVHYTVWAIHEPRSRIDDGGDVRCDDLAIGRRLAAANLPVPGTGDSVVLDWLIVELFVGAAKEKFTTGWGKFDAEFFTFDSVFGNSIQEEWGSL
jgi:hypothetical protein